jgi:hypothetical protein
MWKIWIYTNCNTRSHLKFKIEYHPKCKLRVWEKIILKSVTKVSVDYIMHYWIRPALKTKPNKMWVWNSGVEEDAKG